MSGTNDSNESSLSSGDAFKMLWPPPMLCGDAALDHACIRVNLLDYAKPKTDARWGAASTGVRGHEEEHDLYFEKQGGLKILPDKIIFDKTVYTNHERETQRLLSRHLQSCCQEQGYPISVKEWANPNQQRDTLRLRLRCRKPKCMFQFQLNWDSKAEHWYISRRRCGKFEHTCGPPATAAARRPEQPEQQPLKSSSTTSKRKEPPGITTARHVKKTCTSSGFKKARVIHDENSNVVNNGFDMLLPLGDRSTVTSTHSNMDKSVHRSDLTMAEGSIVQPKGRGQVVPEHNDGEAIASLMALSGQQAAAASAAAPSKQAPAVTWAGRGEGHDGGDDLMSFRISRASQAFAELIETMPLETRSKLTTTKGIVYRARMDRDGLYFEPCSQESSSSSSSLSDDGDDTARDTRDPSQQEVRGEKGLALTQTTRGVSTDPTLYSTTTTAPAAKKSGAAAVARWTTTATTALMMRGNNNNNHSNQDALLDAEEQVTTTTTMPPGSCLPIETPASFPQQRHSKMFTSGDWAPDLATHEPVNVAEVFKTSNENNSKAASDSAAAAATSFGNPHEELSAARKMAHAAQTKRSAGGTDWSAEFRQQMASATGASSEASSEDECERIVRAYPLMGP